MISDFYIEQFGESTSIKDIQNLYEKISYSDYRKISILIVACSEVSCFKLALSTAAKCFGIKITYEKNEQGNYDGIILVTEDFNASKNMYLRAALENQERAHENHISTILQEVNEKIVELKKEYGDATIYLHTLAYFLYSPLGIQDGVKALSTDELISNINQRINQEIGMKYDNVNVIPYHRYATTITRALWDETPWKMIKDNQCERYMVNLLYPTLYLLHYIYPKYNQRIKGMVLDLDDTLWGGTLAEVGAENISLDMHLPGYYYLRLQENIKCLEHKGVFTSIASKNHLDEVNAVMENKEGQFIVSPSVIKADLSKSKVDMIKEISSELNGIDTGTLAFLDNSNLERKAVSQFDNRIKIPEYNGNIALQEEMFLKMPYIEKDRINKEDLNRSTWYIKKKEENLLEIGVKKLPGKSLLESIDRIYDLIHKTNQFNMTTQRLRKSEICEKIRNRELLVFQSEFKDNAEIEDEIFSIVIIKEEERSLEIENFIMSCRYLGFDIDKKVFQYVIELAREKSKKYIIGKYKLSERNRVVRNWYRKMHFLLILDEGGESTYRCLVSDLERIIKQENKFDLQEYLNKNILLKSVSSEVKRLREKDHSVEVLVKPEKIKYGVSTQEAAVLEDLYGLYPESDRNDEIIEVKGFWIDKYCITNEQYAMFLNNYCSSTKTQIGILEKIHQNQPCCKLYFDEDLECVRAKKGTNNLPVVVGYEFAKIYAEWIGGRLPNEYEWEVAAGGADNRWFPWGNEVPNFKYVSIDAGGPSVVDRYGYNISPYGLVQMVGNVWQWCEGTYNNHNIYRGGDYRFDSAYWKRIQLRPIESAEHCGNQVGFRVVRDLEDV